MKASSLFLALALCVAGSTLARADTDPETLYDFTVEAPKSLSAGGTGAVTVHITPKSGAEIHKDAPAKLIVTPSANLTFAKATFSHDDLKLDGNNGSFEAPFTATAAGKGTIDAKVSFYICTDKSCTPQTRTASLTVAVH